MCLSCRRGGVGRVYRRALLLLLLGQPEHVLARVDSHHEQQQQRAARAHQQQHHLGAVPGGRGAGQQRREVLDGVARVDPDGGEGQPLLDGDGEEGHAREEHDQHLALAQQALEALQRRVAARHVGVHAAAAQVAADGVRQHGAHELARRGQQQPQPEAEDVAGQQLEGRGREAQHHEAREAAHVQHGAQRLVRLQPAHHQVEVVAAHEAEEQHAGRQAQRRHAQRDQHASQPRQVLEPREDPRAGGGGAQAWRRVQLLQLGRVHVHGRVLEIVTQIVTPVYLRTQVQDAAMDWLKKKKEAAQQAAAKISNKRTAFRGQGNVLGGGDDDDESAASAPPSASRGPSIKVPPVFFNAYRSQ
ncbi:hypothetical protein ON010_g10737 [Phytophthora cinnamomi]|nr:hypothetical protein ON010_g10737 [Phytophthora cinnamomi]